MQVVVVAAVLAQPALVVLAAVAPEVGAALLLLVLQELKILVAVAVDHMLEQVVQVVAVL